MTGSEFPCVGSTHYEGCRCHEARRNARIKELEDALYAVICQSHAWIIKKDTAFIEMPIHDAYRKIAEKVLSFRGGDKT